MALQILTGTAKPFFLVFIVVKNCCNNHLERISNQKQSHFVRLKVLKHACRTSTFLIAPFFTPRNTIILNYHYYNQAL